MSTNPYETYTPPEIGGLYIKLSDGQSVTLRIAGEPVVYEETFERQGEDPRVSTRYAWKALDVERQEPVILQGGIRMFKDIATLATNPNWGDPTKYDITIKRTGVELSTKYSITPIPNMEPLSSEAIEALTELDLKEKVSAGKGVQHVYFISEAIPDPKA